MSGMIKDQNSFEMNLENEPFRLISSGHKKIEARLNDEKRQKLSVGDIIHFTNKKTGEILKANITELLKYPDFKSLFDSCSIFEFGSNNKDVSLKKMRKYYSEDDERLYGVLGIKIIVLK